MPTWLRILLGLEDDEAPAAGETIWELSGLPSGDRLFFALLVVGLAVTLIILLYRRERTLSAWRRGTLSALRLGALTLIVTILLNPRLITEIEFERRGKTIVLWDVSASMEQEDTTYTRRESQDLLRATGLDPTQPRSRTALARAAFDRNEILRRLAEKNELHLFAMAEKVARVQDVDSLDALESSGLEGTGTAIGDALVESVRQTGSDLLAGLIVVSDGRNNAGERPRELLRNPLSWASIPVHTIGVGKQALPKNYSIVDLVAPGVVETDFPAQIEAEIRISGLRAPVKVALTREREDGSEETLIEERFLEPTSQLLETQLKFIDIVQEKGTYLYRIEIPIHPEETQRRDNVKTARVVVTDERHRVLLVSGSPTLEYRFLRDFALRDPGIQVSCWLTSADPAAPRDGDVVIDALPETAEELEPYEVVFLMDPDPTTLSRRFQQSLITFVSEQGGGLVYVAGETFTHRLATGSASELLRKLLPVELGRRRGIGTMIYDSPWRPRLTTSGLDHALCRLVDDPAHNRQLWRVLPPFYFSYPTVALKPSAIALLADEEDGIVAALHRAGIGDCFYLGCDEFSRWNASSVDYPERFWTGIVRYLAEGKRRAGMREITVETDRDRYIEGEQAQIFLHVQEAGGAKLSAPHQEVEIVRLELDDEEIDGDAAGRLTSAPRDGAGPQDSGPRKVRLYAVPGQANRFAGFLRTREPGEFAVIYESQERTSFRVRPLSNEWEDPSPDMRLLEDISELSGGQHLRLPDAASVVDLTPDHRVTEIVGRRAATLWDTATLMLLFCGLLTLEWTLRKLWHLN